MSFIVFFILFFMMAFATLICIGDYLNLFNEFVIVMNIEHVIQGCCLF